MARFLPLYRLRAANTRYHFHCRELRDVQWYLSSNKEVNFTSFGVRPACRLTTLANDTSVSIKLYSHTKAGHTVCAAATENSVDAICTAAGSYVNRDAQAPTCTKIGWNAYQTCENCDYTTYVEIPVNGSHGSDRRCRCADLHRNGSDRGQTLLCLRRGVCGTGCCSRHRQPYD